MIEDTKLRSLGYATSMALDSYNQSWVLFGAELLFMITRIRVFAGVEVGLVRLVRGFSANLL